MYIIIGISLSETCEMYAHLKESSKIKLFQFIIPWILEGKGIFKF